MPVAPPSPVSAHGVVLRLPEEGDVSTLADYAPAAAANGIWLPVGELDVQPLTWAAWFVRELRLGWTPAGGRYGGGLVAHFEEEPVAAYLNFVPQDRHGVELCYGVAPDRRGRGLASVAAEAATAWALSAGLRRVELHIDAEHAESQRVALKAGFVEARRLERRAATTGAVHQDVVYVRTG